MDTYLSGGHLGQPQPRMEKIPLQRRDGLPPPLLRVTSHQEDLATSRN